MNRDFAAALKLLGRVVVASEPYAEQLIVIGGMAPVIYRSMTGFATTRLPPPGTTEIDVSVPPKLVASGRPMLELLNGANLVAYDTPGYRNAPGAQCFQDASHGTERKAPTYVEFLAPLRGRGKKEIVEIEPGMRAEALRYLDLLAFEPIVVTAAQVPDLEVDEERRLRVPQPALYVAQKILSRSSGRRMNPKKAEKDLAYVYDVAVLSQPQWTAQAALLVRAASQTSEWRKWIAKTGRELRELFASPLAEGPIHAARIFRDLMGSGGPSEDEVQKVVQRFAEKVFPSA